jgi:hypothetical protein
MDALRRRDGLPIHMPSDLQVRYVRTIDDLALIVELEKKVFKNPDNLLTIPLAEHWIRQFSKAMLILYDSRGNIWGYAKCLPISEATLDSMWQSGADIRAWLTARNVLWDQAVLSNAVTGIGNYCYAGVVTFDSLTNQENYEELAIPIWRKFTDIFHRICFKGLICQSHTPSEEPPIENAGCERGPEVGRTCDGNRVVWRFGPEHARRHPTKGLGLVFNEVWPSSHENAVMDLTTTERMIVLLSLWGHDDDENAGVAKNAAAVKTLGMKPRTLTTHWVNIRTKYRELQKWGGTQTLPRITESMVIEYCRRHPVELFGKRG